MTSNCCICAELKPRFFKPLKSHLIKATQPMERLSIDFKGPLPSTSRNKYLLTVVDEYSRFPFAFPCSGMDARNVILCLSQLFSLFGLCSFIHSDRGPAFVSNDFITFAHEKGIALSRTSIYNPRGNGQCEKYNDTIWRTIKLALKNRNMHISKWESVLPDVLHSIRSLLCTATNVTPHERFMSFQRRSMLGVSVPTWLISPGPVMLKRHVRSSKYDTDVEKVELIHATPSYARVKFSNGREATVSLRDIAPVGESNFDDSEVVYDDENIDVGVHNNDSVGKNVSSDLVTEVESGNGDNEQREEIRRTNNNNVNDVENVNSPLVLRRSTRARKCPDRLSYDHDYIRKF